MSDLWEAMYKSSQPHNSDGDPYANARALVNERFSITTDYADEAWTDALEYLELLSDTVVDLTMPTTTLTYDFPMIDVDASIASAPDRPTITLEFPEFLPEMQELVDVSVDDVDIPSLSAVAPAIGIPDTPTVTDPEAPGDAPTMGEVDYPTRPSHDLPTVPTIDQIILSAAPQVTIPSFEGTSPTDNLEAPASVFLYSEEVYASTTLDKLRDKLEEIIDNGGTGLGADVEDDIWDRARDRAAITNNKTYEEALNFFAARGHNLPPGPLMGRLQRANTEISRSEEQISMEIAIEQARLAQEMEKFVITNGLQFENQLLTHSDNVANRSFEAAKYTQQAAIDVFNAQVNLYNTRVKAYGVKADVFKTRVEASLLELERFKVELESARVSAAVQAQYVDIYRAQLAAIETTAKIYATEMESAKIQSDVERARIEGFRARVDAFTAQIGANTAKYNAWQAQITGEMAKSDVYKSEVQAFLAEVEAARGKMDIEVAQATALIETNKAKVDQFRAELGKYTAQVDAAGKEVEVLARSYEAEVAAYGEEVKAANVKVEAKIASYNAMLAHERHQTELLIKQMDANLKAAVSAWQIQIGAQEAASKVSAQMAASALSSVNATAQLGFRQEFQNADSARDSTSRTDPLNQESTRYHHQYNYAGSS